MAYKVQRYGWVPDLPDARDHLYAAPMAMLKKLPASVDLTSSFPDPPYNQGELGSCTANAIAAAIQFGRKKHGQTPNFIPSRLFIYYNERAMEGTVNSDSGAQIRDGIKSVVKLGDCREDPTWPYDVTKFTAKPPPPAFTEAANYQVTSYSRVVQTLNQLKGCLASGYPFVFGFTVYESFESPEVASSGDMPMPAPTEQVMGGHAVVGAGYDDATQRFLIRNSWGTDWGKNGYFTMPYAYITENNLADDFWTIRLVEE